MMKYNLDELQRKVSEVALGRETPRDVKTEIEQYIRVTRTDIETVTRLRLLLGQLYMWMKEPAKSRAQYRKVLEQDPSSIEAMMGIGRSFQAISRYGKAEEWFRAAYRTAEMMQDYVGQLAALDEIALNAGLRGDTVGVTATLNEMCRVLASAPRVDGVFTMIAEYLLMNKKGAAALPLLECYIKHILERGYPRSYQYTVLRPFVEIQRREGRSDEEISVLLAKFRPLAADESMARDFDIATAWAFEKGRLHYQYVYRDELS